MESLNSCCNIFTSSPLFILSSLPPYLNALGTNKLPQTSKHMQQNLVTNRCKTCKGQGSIDCAGCKGTGKNKKNGNIFERWKCFDCQGFGLKSCPVCGKGGLTPEQRGER